MNNIDAVVNRCIDFEEARKAAHLTRGIIMVDVQLPRALNRKFPESIIKRKAIAFIDRGIDDYQTLVNGVNAGITVHVLDSRKDGVAQITDILQQQADVDAIHIISHGKIGCLTLGNSVLSTDTLSKYRHALFSWQEGFRKNAEIHIYGCDVAKDATGRAFIESLANITGANIAASDNLTGNSAYGGDWKLRVATGNITAESAFCEEKLKHFATTLATNTLDFTNDTVTDFVTATHPTADFGTISFKIVSDENSTGVANGSLTLASTGSVDDTFDDFFYGAGSDGEYVVIYTDGREVDFQSIGFGSGNGSTYTSLTVHAYRDGTLLGNQIFSPAGANFPNNTSDSETITFTDNIFENADEIRFIGVDGANVDVVNALIDDVVIADAVPANTTPAISINNANLAYTENMAATQVDAAATLTDADGDADWNGGTLVVQITANNEASDQLSIVDNAVGTINASGTNLLDGATVIGTLSAAEGTVTNGTALTITFNGNATNALVQQVARAIHYSSTSDDPGTSNRTITFTATDTNAAGANDTRTVSVTAVNDEPALTATGANPTFTEGGAAASLFSGTSIDTVESGQNITGLSFTITNVTNGSNERINVDGTTIVLTHGTNGSTAGNSLNYSVMVIGTTATVTMTGGNLSVAAAQTLIDNMSYQNNSNSPSTSNRVVTLTSIQDSGGTANGGDNTGSLAVASTVTVVQNNDEPTLTANGSNPTFTEGGAAGSLFNGTNISTVEAGQTIKGFTFTISNVANGINEVINIDGTAIVLTHGTSGSTAGNSLSYSVTVVGTTATVALTGGTMSTATVQTLIDNMSYQNNSNTPSTSNRVVTLTSIQDSGGTANGGDDTASVSVASTVTVVGVNDEPTLTGNASNPTFTEGGAAASLFTGTDINTVESGQNITGLSFTITNVTNGSNERINVDGTTIVLTHGTNGSTAGNSLNYSVMVIGTTATVTMTGGNLSVAAAQTLIDNMSYQNNSNSPSTSNRVVTLTSIQDSGGTANGGDNTGSLAVASTVTVVQNNDEPTLTANGSNPTFTEGGAAGSLFNGTNISTVEAGQTIKGFTFTISNVANGINEVINIDGTAIVLTHGTSGSTAGNSLSYSVTVVGTTATVALTGGTMSTATVQTLIDNMSYQNNSNTPSTSNRVVTLTSIQDSGGTANGGDDTASVSVASTVTVVGVNDEPTLTGNASNPTFTEGGAAASLFTGTDINTVESGQNITGLSFTITNVTNGSNERINVDGTTIVLTHGTNGSTAGNSLNYSVMVIGTTATVTMTGGNLSVAAAETLIDNMSYQNNSNSPSTSNRVVTLTSIQDSGGTANGGDNTGSLAVASTVTVVQNNDEPTLTATSANPTFTEGGAAASLFSGAAASTIESGQTLSGLTLTVTNVNDGSNERLNTDGTTIALTHGTAGTTASNSLSYSVSVVGTTATVSFTGGTLSTAAAQTLIDGISYQNNSNDPDTSNRVVTLTSLQDSGGTANGGDDTAALGISSTVTVTANPAITSASYDYSTNQLVVTGTDFVTQGGAVNDVDISLLTVTGEGGATYTLTSANDVEIDSATQFTVTLSGADLINVETLLNKNGTESEDATTFNLAAADNWMTGTSAAPDISDASNAITVSNYSVPTITSATYNASIGQLVISGDNFVSQAGAANDLDASLLTITGDGGNYTLTDTADVDVNSDTSASLTLSAADQLNIHGLLNKDGTTSGGAVTYNLAAADNWLFGAPATNDIGDTTGNAITVSNVQIPTITSAAYNASTHDLVVTGANLFKKAGANNDIDVSLFTMVGGDNENYTLATTTDVEITSATSFTIHVTGADQSALDDIFDQLGTTSSFATTYDIQTADNWLIAADPATNIADNNAEGGVNVMIPPAITSSAYDAATGVIVVTGSNIQANGGGSDIDVSRLTFTGEGGTTYTLTDSADVERDSITQFTVTMSATDKAAINQIVNKDGTTSTGGTSYNLAAADDWNTNITADDTSDASNSITVSNVPVPTVTSATYNASTGVIAVTGTNYMSASGATNDIIANKFTFTGEGGESYTLTDSANVDITSGTAFTLTLSAVDEAAINQIINKNGISSTSGTSYNLAAAEDWAAGADAAANVVDATGNAITVSNVAVPAITSATYHTGTGLLSVTGTDFLKRSGAANDIDASLFTFTGEAGATYTLTDTADVEITSITAFALTLSATDIAAVNLLLNKNGAASVDATTYNLAAAEDWAVGADAAVNVADITANGIMVTIPAPSSGGGGGGGGDTPTPPQITENTIDGVNTRTTTEEDGSTTINVDVTEDSREDDPATLSANHADIPVQVDTEGEPVLIVSLPTGVGLNVNGQSAALDTQDAVEDLIARIEQRTAADSSQRLDMTVHGQDFITSLATGDTVAVQTITPTVSGEQAPNAPIIITATDDSAGGNKQALVIDASNLPSGSVLQLDNVSFAAIVGAVQIVGGAGQNFAAGDHQNQFIVMGADDDRLFGGGGDDTVGSLGGNDLTSGDAGNDIVYGGSANDIISGGSGNDRLNGGFGFDIALQAGQQFDYQIEALGNQVILTHTSGTVDILTDTEFVYFDNGPGLAIAHSAAEAAAHHLVKTWLGRDLTADEGVAVQNWQGADAADMVRAFHELPEAAAFLDKTADELLAGLDDNPDIIRLDVNREIIAGDGDDQGYLPMGLALNADGNAGYDVLRMLNSRRDVHLETAGDRLELTRFEDGAMLSLRNAEAIAFDSGETVILAHNTVEGTLARLVHTLLNRGATLEEWQAGRQALADNVEAQAFFNWFQDRTDFDQLSDSEYIQTLFQNTLQRLAASEEVNGYLAQLNDGSLNRDWLAVDIAQSEEAIAVIGSVIELDGGI
jgi:riboflavin synthase